MTIIFKIVKLKSTGIIDRKKVKTKHVKYEESI